MQTVKPHLRRDMQVDYYLNKEATYLTELAVRETFERWESVTSFRFTYRGRHRAGLMRDGKNTVSFLVEWPSEIPMGKTAYCRNWYNRRGDIVESDIIFNMAVTRFTTLRTNTPQSYYIEGVLSHEIGHMIGLDHIEDEKSIMKPFSPRSESYFLGEIDETTIKACQTLYAESGVRASR
ncbi:MAG: matrixin family metalloprotease [Spirochaetota bacterium]